MYENTRVSRKLSVTIHNWKLLSSFSFSVDNIGMTRDWTRHQTLTGSRLIQLITMIGLSLLSPIKTLNIVVVDFSISNWDTEAVVKPRDTAR